MVSKYDVHTVIIDLDTCEIWDDTCAFINSIRVDEPIARTIALLNKKGYITTYCCSGHIYPALSYDSVTGKKEICDSGFHCHIWFAKEYSFEFLPSCFQLQPPEPPSRKNREPFYGGVTRILKSKVGTVRREKEVAAAMKALYRWAEALPVNK
jgi:hypothetical protein